MDEEPDRAAGGDDDGGGEGDEGDGDDASLEFAVLGGPDGGPALDLHHEQFAYAGKFVMSGTGKAVLRERDTGLEARSGDVLAAAAFDRDRTDGAVVRIRYVTVRRDRRGEGLGARLLASVADWALGRAEDPGDDTEAEYELGAEGSTGTGSTAGVDSPPTADSPATVEPTPGDVREVRIAVNNPFAYEAAFKAGFGYDGERTGLAELVCVRPGDRSADAYRRGFSAFVEREDLTEPELEFVGDRRDAEPPESVAPLSRP